MKKVFLGLCAVLLFMAVSFGANADKQVVKYGKEQYALEYRTSQGEFGLTDTLAVTTGNSITIYADSTKDVGMVFTTDSIRYYAYLYGDADACSIELKMNVQLQPGIVTMKPIDGFDTLSTTDATAEFKTGKFKNYKGFAHVPVFTSYGTTDANYFIGIRFIGE